jgi:hypothetical protein
MGGSGGFAFLWASPASGQLWQRNRATSQNGWRVPDGRRSPRIGASGKPRRMPCPHASLVEAQRRVGTWTREGIEELRERHRAWWRGFWSQSFVRIGDPLIERYYHGSQYLLASCSRNPRFPPSLYGNWITADGPSWQADYHLNDNHQAPWWGVFSSNHPNLMIFTGGGGIENCSGVPATVNEMLVPSHQGVLRLFPVWPRNRDASFGRLRTPGAFLVSAELRQGQIGSVVIESERGPEVSDGEPVAGSAGIVAAPGSARCSVGWRTSRMGNEGG